MIDNFFENDYHSYDQVYQHRQTFGLIFIGDVQSALNTQFHHECNIKTVITAAKDMEHVLLDSPIKHVVYPLLDGKNQNISLFFQQFYEIVQESIKKGNILVHCAAGISRSSTLVISYVMKKEKMTFKQAITLLRRARPNILPNLGFQRQLKKYEEQIRKNDKFSRSSKRSNAKTSISGNSNIHRGSGHQLSKFQEKVKDNSRVISLNFNMNKLTNKQLRIIKIYNRGNFQSLKSKWNGHKKVQSFEHKCKKPQKEGSQKMDTFFKVNRINGILNFKANKIKDEACIWNLNRKIQIKNPLSLNQDRHTTKNLIKKEAVS